MNPFGKLLMMLYIVRVYRNGDGFSFVWRFWNPLSWVLAPIAFLGCAYSEGVPYTLEYKHEIGFGIDPYFIKHPEQLEWL